MSYYNPRNQSTDFSIKRKRRSGLEMLHAPTKHENGTDEIPTDNERMNSKKVCLSIQTESLSTNKEQSMPTTKSINESNCDLQLFTATSTYQDKDQNGGSTEFTASITSPFLNDTNSIATSFTTTISLPVQALKINLNGITEGKGRNNNSTNKIKSTCTVSTSATSIETVNNIQKEHNNDSTNNTSNNLKNNDVSNCATSQTGR